VRIFLKRIGFRDVVAFLKSRSVRHAAMLGLVVATAAIQVPRVARAPLGQTALINAPAAIADVALRLVDAQDASHLGFDTNMYPGDRAMDAWRRSGEYEWVGYYLEAPCHQDDTWSGKRTRLARTGWGLAVVYVGQQTWGQKLGATANQSGSKAKSSGTKSASRAKSLRSRRSPRAMTRKSSAPVARAGATCSAAFVNAGRGRRDAADAIRKTTAEGFAPGSVIFLDIERMESIPQRMREYYRAWTAAVLEDGMFRPGVYAHTHNAKSIYADLRAVFDAFGVRDDPPFWIAGSRDFDIDKVPTEVGHTFADVWQGMLDVVRTHNGVKLPIDISVSALANPSSATD
jgi:hypothetical protein